MRVAFAVFLVLHGLIHLMGFARAFHLAEIPALKAEISQPMGLLWLAGALLLILTAILLFAAPGLWPWVGLVALIVSQAAIISDWSDARFGAIANLIGLAPVAVGLLLRAPSGYMATFEREAQEGLSRPASPTTALTEADLATLPAPVAAYLRYTGSVGRPRPANLHMTFLGSMRKKATDDWMDVTGEQYSFFDTPTRLFYIRSKMYGLPFEGLHVYRDGKASMRIRLAGLLEVVDASGPKMDQSETVTLLNDLCFMAPARLLDPSVTWTPVDALSAVATYTNAGQKVSATLRFDERGAMTDFVTDDRYLSPDGVEYQPLRWSTPVQEYREFGGLKLPALAEARWHAPEGEYAYARFELREIVHNASE